MQGTKELRKLAVFTKVSMPPRSTSNNSWEAQLREPFHKLVTSSAGKAITRVSKRKGAKRAHKLLKLCQHLATFLCIRGV